MADNAIALQVQTPDSFKKIGEVLNFARWATELQKARATLESDISQRKAESERAGIETGVARDTAAPRVTQAAETAKQAQIKSSGDQFKLTGDYAQKARDISQGLVADPDIIAGKVEGIVPKIAQARQMMIDSGIPPAIAEAQSATLMAHAIKDPASIRQILLNSIQAGIGSTGQSANTQEGGIQVGNNAQTSVISTRPLSGTPVGQPIAGTPQTLQLPLGERESVAPNPVTGNPQTTVKNAQGNVTGVSPTPTTGVPNLAVGQKEDIPILTNTRSAVNTAAARVPESRFNNKEIIRLADATNTGVGAQAFQNLKGGYAAIPWTADSAKNLNSLGHFIALEASNNAAAMGAGTDAARALAEQKTASTGWTKDAIKAAAKVNDALAVGVENFNKGMEAAVQKAGGNVLAVRPFQNAWSAAFDPNVYRFANAMESGDKAEMTKILGPEGSPQRKAKAAELARKSATLYRLSTEGQ